MAGVVLVVAASGLPDITRTVAAAVPDTAFMGLALPSGRMKPGARQARTAVTHPNHAP
jgi:hypothetical protein